ncbi:shikimate kinase [Alkalicoccus chagannorensis]|uniref:shikimate kinase n=1 Tax=Alkalicoccus chagannorensis TaxID=427072 RepID=UPI00040E9242|nr:shikimate kinase [Alkalicoccus chagannorensis]
MKEPIYLTGFMGVGKTTVGGVLAEKLGRKLIDLDQYIEKKDGREIPAIFQESGEEAFRLLELDAVRELRTEPHVIATGGGVVETSDVRMEMKTSGTVIFLEAPFDTLFQRIEGDETRPLTKEGQTALKERYERRLPLYQEADVIISTENRTPRETADEIIRFIR